MEQSNQPNNGGASAQKEGGDDRIHNLKMELERKMSNAESQIKKLADTNAALLKQIESLKTPPPSKPAPTKKVGDLLYDDPDQAVSLIKQETRQELLKEIEDRDAAKMRQAQTINELYDMYPELASTEHEMTKKTLERYGKMSDQEKTDPKSLKIAAYETALELDVKPRSKRGDDDSFSFGSTPSGGTKPGRGKKSDKLDPNVAEFAQLMGLDLSNEKVVERLKSRQRG